MKHDVYLISVSGTIADFIVQLIKRFEYKN